MASWSIDIHGAERFTFGSSILRDGVDFITVMIRIYAMGGCWTDWRCASRWKAYLPYKAAASSDTAKSLSMWGH